MEPYESREGHFSQLLILLGRRVLADLIGKMDPLAAAWRVTVGNQFLVPGRRVVAMGQDVLVTHPVPTVLTAAH